MRLLLYFFMAFTFVSPQYASEENHQTCPTLKGHLIRDLASTFPQETDRANIPAPMKLMRYVPLKADHEVFETKVFEGVFFSANIVGDFIITFPKSNKQVCLYDIPNPHYDPLQAGVMANKSLGILEVNKEGISDPEQIKQIKEIYTSSGEVPLVPDINNYESYIDSHHSITKSNSDHQNLKRYFDIYHGLAKDDSLLIGARCIVLDKITRLAKTLNLQTLYADSTGKVKNLLLLDAAMHPSVELNIQAHQEQVHHKTEPRIAIGDQETSYYRFILKNVYGYSSKGIGVTKEGYPLTWNNSWETNIAIYWEPLVSNVPYYSPNALSLDSAGIFFMQLENIFSNFPQLVRGKNNPVGEGFLSPQRTPEIINGVFIETEGLPNKGNPINENNLMYALDENKNLHIGNTINHPDFTRGRSVICAGHLSIEGGKIIKIDTSSGHYVPRIWHLNAAIKILNEKNILHPKAKLTVYANHQTIKGIIEHKRHGIINNPEEIERIKNSPYKSYGEQFDQSYLPLIHSNAEVRLEPPYVTLSLEDFGKYVDYSYKDWQKELLENHAHNPNSILGKIIELSKSNKGLKEMLFGH